MIVYSGLGDLVMSKQSLYKELYALSKGSVINEFLLVKSNHFNDLLTSYKINKSEIEDCIIKITASNVYLSAENLLDKLPEETVYIDLIKIKRTVLKRLPSFIKTLVDSIPLRLSPDQSSWSLDELVINSTLMDLENLEDIERFLGEAYWLVYKDLIDYEGVELVDTMSDIACKKLTNCHVEGIIGEEISKLYQHANFNKVKALIKSNDESSILLELLNLNSKCKENS